VHFALPTADATFTMTIKQSITTTATPFMNVFAAMIDRSTERISGPKPVSLRCSAVTILQYHLQFIATSG